MRIGIFGGSFDPIHNDHFTICKKFKENLNLDRVFVLPTHLSPFKSEYQTPPKMRKEMVEIAFSSLSGVSVSDFEINLGGQSYTYKTVEHFKNLFPSAQIFLLIGLDSLTNFLKWKNVEYILQNANLAVAGRGGYHFENEVQQFKEKTGKQLYFFSYDGKISSTFVRELLKLGVLPEEYLDKEVLNYIVKNQLYKGDYNYDLVKNRLKKSRLIHTAGVITLAVTYAKRLGIDSEKARLSALLHDIAKYEKREDYLFLNLPDNMPESIVHQHIGAHLAKNILKIEDCDIINAINFHSTGRPEMSTLEKIIFVADLLEQGRTYAEVDELRKAVDENFEEGFKLCIQRLINFINKSGQPLYELTALANQYYNNK